jgi:hypothetical protein
MRHARFVASPDQEIDAVRMDAISNLQIGALKKIPYCPAREILA